MTLAATEVMKTGFVRDTSAACALVTTTSQNGARMSGGFLRDPDGRLVVQNG